MPRALIADDSPADRTLLQIAAAGLGYDCDLVESGDRAFERIIAGSYDILLTDLDMPGMNGHACARALRARESALGLPRLPIVAVSGSDLSFDLIQDEESPFDAELTKTADIRSLTALLEKTIKQTRAHQRR